MENYFNYFTEIEECYRRCRETPTLLSTLDWALVESWKEAGLPLEAVLAGIERAFEKFRARPRRFQKVNSLAYCTQEVMRAAEQMQAGRSPREDGARKVAAPFAGDEVQRYFTRNAEALENAARRASDEGQSVLAEDLSQVAGTLREMTSPAIGAAVDLEPLERRLTAIEEKLAASLTRASSVELLTRFREEVERGLAPYRQKMSGAQVESLERQFLKKRLFEHYRLPRLSLFYL